MEQDVLKKVAGETLDSSTTNYIKQRANEELGGQTDENSFEV